MEAVKNFWESFFPLTAVPQIQFCDLVEEHELCHGGIQIEIINVFLKVELWSKVLAKEAKMNSKENNDEEDSF